MSVLTLTTNETESYASVSTLSFPNSSESEYTYNTNPTVTTSSEVSSIPTLVFHSESGFTYNTNPNVITSSPRSAFDDYYNLVPRSAFDDYYSSDDIKVDSEEGKKRKKLLKLKTNTPFVNSGRISISDIISSMKSIETPPPPLSESDYIETNIKFLNMSNSKIDDNSTISSITHSSA
tara:strand:- start:402 stop:935 length:534 start_codon:yes stop_codon:yes gene_type:complete